MKTSRFEVLSRAEVERIHAASMEILATVGIRVDYGRAREIFRQAGADVDEAQQCVRIPEQLVRWAVGQAPKEFTLHGFDPEFRLAIGGDRINFAGLGTPTHILDTETGERREGSYYAFASFFQKLATGAALWAMAQAFAATGYITPTSTTALPVQPPAALGAIRFFAGPVPAALLVLAILCAWKYPITRASHQAMLAELATQVGREA